jgi:inner membrane protein
MDNQIPWHKTRSAQITFKLAMILFLMLVLLIPKFALLSLVEERQDYYNQVNEEVAKGWGSQQIISSPVLAIPYYRKTKEANGVESTVEDLFVVAADQCTIEGDLITTTKQRSIYEVLLYKSSQKITGYFSIKSFEAADIPKDMMFSKAFIAMGINDLKGLDSKVDFNINGQAIPSQAGMNGFNIAYGFSDDRNIQAATSYGSASEYSSIAELKNGLHIPYPISDFNLLKIEFTIKLDIKGSQKLSYVPNALNFTTHIKSAYPHPGFNGAYLPEHTTSEKGFDAKWKLLEYNKNLPHFNQNATTMHISDGIFGINVKPLLNHYSSTYRAGKYMILVIVLTFLVIFLIELIKNHRIHLFQYTLIGLAIAIFFILLLSFSEVVGFTSAFAIATIATCGLTYMYSISVFKNNKSAIMVLGMQSLIYAFIFTILRMEETSLLVGSIGLFLILAATMWFTRQINWYE